MLLRLGSLSEIWFCYRQLQLRSALLLRSFPKLSFLELEFAHLFLRRFKKTIASFRQLTRFDHAHVPAVRTRAYIPSVGTREWFTAEKLRICDGCWRSVGQGHVGKTTEQPGLSHRDGTAIAHWLATGISGSSLSQGAAGTCISSPAGACCFTAWWRHPMLTDAAILLGVFAAGYGLRAWISNRRRRAARKARGDH